MIFVLDSEDEGEKSYKNNRKINMFLVGFIGILFIWLKIERERYKSIGLKN